jgi:hypothetical protein
MPIFLVLGDCTVIGTRGHGSGVLGYHESRSFLRRGGIEYNGQQCTSRLVVDSTRHSRAPASGQAALRHVSRTRSRHCPCRGATKSTPCPKRSSRRHTPSLTRTHMPLVWSDTSGPQIISFGPAQPAHSLRHSMPGVSSPSILLYLS